jgi:hypothetical protein
MTTEATMPISELTVLSAAFVMGTSIPARFTCKGPNDSPQLTWSAGPAGTASYALIVDDPDAPAGDWVHWMVFNLPPDVTELKEAQPKNFKLPNGAVQAMNDFGKPGYGGPCPPPGKPHRYFFKVFALDTKLALNSSVSKKELLKAMEGHVVAQGTLMGTFGR